MTPVKYTKKNPTKAFVALGFSLLCLASPARSQDEASEDEIFDMNALVVVANKTEVPLDQIGSTVNIIDAYDIQKTEQEFILDSIRYVPGIYLRNNGGPGSAAGITVRGLNSNPPTVLVDGIEMDNPSNGQMLNFGNIFGNNVSRVDILKGPQSSLYGANALAGVISVESKSGRTDPGSEIGVSYGSFNTLTGNISTRGVNEQFDWAVNASYYDRDFSVQDPSFGPEWADQDKYENKQVSTKLNYQLNDDTELNFVIFWQDAFSEFDPGDPESQWGPPEAINFSENERTTARVGSKFKIADNWSSELAASYSDINYATTSGTEEDARYESNGDRYNFEWNNTAVIQDNWTLIGGIEHEIEKNISNPATRDNTSLFIENVSHATEALDVTLGGRVDENSDYGTQTTWRTTFSYKMAEDNSRIRGSYGTSFQAPSFYQLNPKNGYGNANMKPEFGTGWDIGFEQDFADGKVFFSTTYFNNEVEDKIIFSYATYKYANEDLYKSWGIETALHFEITEEAKATVSHTYSDANYRDGTEAERVPRNIYSAVLDWEPAENFTLTTTALLVSSQYSLKTSSTKQDGYIVINLAAQYVIDSNWEVWGRIDNLFDENYEEIYSYQTSGLAGYGGVRYSF